MDNKENRKIIWLGIIAVALTSILGSLVGIIPFSGIFIYFISIMFFICAKKRGFVFALPFLIAAYVFVSFSTSFSSAIADIFGPGMTAILMGELLRLKRNSGEVLGKGILTGILCNLASLISLKLVEKKSLLDEMRNNIEYFVNSAIKTQDLTLYEAGVLKNTYESLLQAVPSILIVIIMLGTIFIYYSGCAIMKKRGEEIDNFFPFKNFSFSRNIIFGSIVILMAGYITGLIGIINADVIMINLSVIICFVFAIQGFAVVIYLVNISRFPKIIAGILIGMMFLSMIGTIILFFIGLLDIIINIRGRINAKRG